MVKKKVKKKIGGRKKNISCKSCHSSLVYGTIALLVVALFLLNFVNVGQGVGITGHATITGYATGDNFIENLFSGWTSGSMDTNIAKYLLFGILTLLIYSAMAYAKFPTEKAPLQWLISIPVAFLATAYITPEVITTILISYTGLGVALGVILPFVILLFFSAMLLANEKISSMSVGKILFQIVLWGAYGAYLIYKLITLVFYGGELGSMPGFKLEMSFPLVALLIVLVLTFIILIWNRKYRKKIRDIGKEVIKSKADVKVAIIDAQKTVGRVIIPTAEEVKRY